LRDWLPDGHLAYFISDTVDQFDLSEIVDTYRGEGKGNVAYHPALMCKLLLYGYATGVFSSRKIALACETDIAFRLLSAEDAPSHRTLARFRKLHLSAFEALFLQVVAIAQGAGLVTLGTLAIDGSKVRANASKRKSMSYGRMKTEEKRLSKEIRALTARAAGVDAAEDVEFGPDFRGDEIPKELERRKDRLRVIRAAKKRLEERKKAEDAEKIAEEERRKAEGKSQSGREREHPLGKPKPKDQENFTDPDSRIMKGGDGFQQDYNTQIAVDGENGIIVAAAVGQNAADTGALVPMIDAARGNTGLEAKEVLADAGYRSEKNFEELEARDQMAFISLGRNGSKATRAINEKLVASHRMKRRMETKRGRARYKRRKHIAEAPFGWIKSVLGFRSFHLRGVDAVRGEWNLICMATNLRRMGMGLM
jgi:transposase